MQTALNLLTERFYLLKLQLCIQLHQDTTLPAFKGSMWHGLLGRALHAHDQKLFQIFYAEHDNQQPKPYVVFPGADHKTQWKKNELISFELILIGDACQMASKVVDALVKASQSKQLGIGEQKVPFTLLSLSSATPQGLRAGIHPLSLADWLTLPNVSSPQEIALHFLTPVRIKHNGKQLKSLPKNLPVNFYINQITRRIIQLSRFWVMDREDIFADIYEELIIPNECEISTHCYFEDWVRYSVLHQKEIPLSGIKGQVSFYGELSHLLPLFKMGELLHIGGKTTFGLGKYQLIS